MDIIKISLLGVCGVMLGFLMKGTKPEYACFITVGIGLVIMGLAVGKIRYLFESLGKIQEALPVDTEYISTLVKMVGITYIGQFASGFAYLNRYMDFCTAPRYTKSDRPSATKERCFLQF